MPGAGIRGGIRMRKKILLTLSLLAVLNLILRDGLITPVHTFAAEQGSVRMPVDTVGYATSPAQVELVVEMAGRYGRSRSGAKATEGLPEGVMTAAICPHDDYLYAGPVYLEVMKRVKAPVVVIFGVCHSCRRAGIEGRLVFDSYDAWKGPYGNCEVSGLREDLIAALPGEYVMVDNGLHAGEHSIESFIPFLQFPGFGGPEAEELRIVPVLVTRLKGELQGKLAGLTASALKEQMNRRGWVLGEDLAVLISADCVHYGDRKWGGRNYAPFGTDREGYQRALEQEMKIIDSSLTGIIDRAGLSRFRELVERDDLEWPYKVTWCGVYSIPFGLRTLLELCELSGREKPEGFLLRYGTSLDAPADPDRTLGLGMTNISTLRHWVGYAGLGYW
ncbi:MAG: AmmeMemoRadiSam system protein B [Candidatus Latescibacteria bacterium]|nr:AmmeMemoRadiSam system protein B [bacterium]MBD3424779.1 AmmeMemoRadiSam system protein B [Candidatus Latescibacterota bacterium]